MTPATKRDIPGDSVDGYAASTRACRRTPSRRHRQASRMWRRNAYLRGSHRLERIGGVRPGEAR